MFDLIIPIAKGDIDTAINNMKYISKNLQPNRIIIISSNEVETKVKGIDGVFFLDENEVIPDLTFEIVKNIIIKRGGNPKRAGWYFQQFLKMGYSFISETDYYLAWDADTVPLKQIDFFDENNKPFFSIKNEYNQPYFRTINRILQIDKQIRGSFIAEHMMFNCSYMNSLIKRIDENKDYSGIWFEKIMYAIDIEDLSNSGFSEFETYGSFIEVFFKGSYTLRKLDTLRLAKLLFSVIPDEDVSNWLSQNYHTISLEKSLKTYSKDQSYLKNYFRYMVSSRYYCEIAILIIRIKKKTKKILKLGE